MAASLSLPILPTASTLAAELDRAAPGQVHFDSHHRLLYATDASLYQVLPLGVVTPTSGTAAQRVVQVCARNNIAMLPRGGGTSLAGQCTNDALVLDLSQHCRNILAVDVVGRTVEVEPGISIEALNLALASSGLFFAPDPATIAQASIGGCIGNNAAGARSIRYGRTSENLESVEVILATGERLRLAANAGQSDPKARELAMRVAAVVHANAALIRERFPKTIRRNAGYALDLILQQLDAGVSAEALNLSPLMCGSEGTLALLVGARLKLHPVPAARGLALATFTSVEAALDSLLRLLKTGPSAIELLDDVVLSCARQNTECRRYVEMLPTFPGIEPAAVLYIEYSSEAESAGQASAELRVKFAGLKNLLPNAAVETYTDPAAIAQAWMLRKSGEPLLHAIPGLRKPLTFVEDNAIPVENLPRFIAEFKRICANHGTTAAYYAHASVGVLHVRPLLNLHDEADREILKKIAVEVADLARSCGGVMSGEHGDGRIRGPLLERFFGPQLTAAFAQIKAIFDPQNLLNPGMIVNTGSVASMTEHLRILPGNKPITFPEIDTFFSYDDQHDFSGALEMCNGAGFCRKTSGGTMCPSYRATLEERHSTRGRANASRLAISGQATGSPDFRDADTLESLRLCLSCKACKSECPSNVDLSRLKAEYLAQGYKEHGTPLAARAFGHIRLLNQLGSIAPRFANAVNASSFVRAILNPLLNLAPQRSIPAFAKSLFRWHKRRAKNTEQRPKILLFADCFTTYNDPHIGRAAITALEAFGYEVLLPNAGCCGRAMISTGLLADATTTADRTAQNLAAFLTQVDAILVAEPSCLSAIKDDWLQLKMQTPLATRQAIAAKSFLVEEFLHNAWDRHPQRPTITQRQTPIILHGHCHQKALWGDATSANLLRRISSSVTVLPTGCCGMAGSFGYTADRYDISLKIGELSLFPPVRNAPANAAICAPGTSCRHQIHDATQRTAQHPMELFAAALAPQGN